MQETLEKYDSEADTREHIKQVAIRLTNVAHFLNQRGVIHDQSKLGPVEKPIFDEVTPKLKNLEYGSDEYRASLREMGPALKHHYENNSHHPEHYEDGISGMDLLDLIEMYCDWCAAALRTKNADNAKGLEINIDRFEITGPLGQILRNTLERHGDFGVEPIAK
jgi:hypothetical protein